MSVLAALAKAYERLPNAAPLGYSSESIGFMISLNADGSVAHVIDLREGEEKKAKARSLVVPASFKRPGVTPRPFFLWDNANYCLGLGTLEDPTDLRFDAFRSRHLHFLSAHDDEGFRAFCSFLTYWKPELIHDFCKLEDISNQRIVFGLEHERKNMLLHERITSKAKWQEVAEQWRAVEGKNSSAAVCLVTGTRAPIARTHPPIRGIPTKSGKDADSIVSFNQESFTSYGHKQGDNAPVSEAATFAYTTALNHFLEKDSGHRVQIGDASVVFWADASQLEHARQAESIASGLLGATPVVDEDDEDDDGKINETTEAKKVASRLEAIRKGEPLEEVAPELTKGVAFHILALAPNAARLSIRFYHVDSFGSLVANYQQFLADMRVDPPPRDGYPPLWRYLVETAVLGKRENVPSSLPGDWMRAILEGRRYPLSLLANVLMRIRADNQVNALRVGILKALVIRNFKNSKEAPVALDPTNTNKGYLLGRLFAAYENTQRAALGDKVNATIKDKYYGAACAQPRKIFALLEKGSANHLSKVGKASTGRRVNLEKLIGEIMGLMDPGDTPFPISLSSEEQALFGLGYYHQRSDFFKKKEGAENGPAPQLNDASINTEIAQ